MLRLLGHGSGTEPQTKGGVRRDGKWSIGVGRAQESPGGARPQPVCGNAAPTYSVSSGACSYAVQALPGGRAEVARGNAAAGKVSRPIEGSGWKLVRFNLVSCSFSTSLTDPCERRNDDWPYVAFLVY